MDEVEDDDVMVCVAACDVHRDLNGEPEDDVDIV